MFLNRMQLWIFTILMYIVLPVLLLLSLFLLKNSLIDGIVTLFFVGNVILLLFKMGHWEFTWYYFRYFIVAAFFVVAFYTIIFLSINSKNIYNFHLLTDGVMLFAALIVVYINIRILQASVKSKNCIHLCFPFQNGRYLITDGGDGKISSLLNYHNKAQIHKRGQANTSMRFATDIAKLNKRGFTTQTVFWKDNEQFEIYHENVYSPCDAVVVDVVDGIENNVPFSRKFPYNVGNCVVLKTSDTYIVMGHFQKGSILVHQGEEVKARQLLAVIGNSGLTPRPHLHMQVSKCEDGNYWGGEGVPIVFEEQIYPTKNKVVTIL